ncbi:MAG: hypothetical protein ACD_75C00760G0003 [uncultured bacterium]|nr:MAG: hypothetical protein ACD_75C00760G0003 [uncultured bacterium]
MPDPVGPVTNNNPCGRLRHLFSISKVSTSKPSLVRSTFSEALSRIRKTTDSPNRVGREETRKSTERFLPMRIFIRPSCGTRRSVMSRPERIFILATKAFLMVRGRFMVLNSEPSLRYRTCMVFS